MNRHIRRPGFGGSIVGVALLVAARSAGATPAIVSDTETNAVVPTTYYSTFSSAHPVLKHVQPGAVIATKTLDAFGKDERDVERGPVGNPLTGPFYVEGAAPGDALVVHFRKVRMNRQRGVSYVQLEPFALGPRSTETLDPHRRQLSFRLPRGSNIATWDIDLERQVVRLRQPTRDAHAIEFSARPMLGCVGVAAAGDAAPSSLISGSYGGNLDYNEIGPGAVVTLPVYHPGALLFIGDGHALQADGEPTGSGIETSMDVEFTLAVRKNSTLAGPRVETADDIISIGSQPEFTSSLDRALQMATHDMVDWLVSEYQLEPWAAHLLIGYEGKYDVVTVAGSMALRIPKKFLPDRQSGNRAP